MCHECYPWVVELLMTFLYLGHACMSVGMHAYFSSKNAFVIGRRSNYKINGTKISILVKWDKDDANEKL